MVEYGCNGSLALKPRTTGLRLIEGGAQAPRGKAQAREGALPAQGAHLRSVLMAAALGALVAALVAMPGLFASAASARALEVAPTHEVTVAAGDTVWSIAGKSQVEGASTRDVKAWIVERNGISDSAIRPGQRIVVPGAQG